MDKVKALKVRIKSLRELLKIIEEENWDRIYLSVGICSNLLDETELGDHAGYIEKLMFEFFQTWPLFSGSRVYPIADPKGQRTASSYYNYTGNLYKGDQLDLRVSLLEHLLSEYEDLCSDLENPHKPLVSLLMGSQNY